MKMSPWLRLLIEGAVIIFSILVAFGIDRWWDGRQRREAEYEILDQLAEEFLAIQDTLSGVVEEHTLDRERVGAMLSLANSSRTGSLTAEEFYSVFLAFTSTYLEARTLDGVMASGQLSLISDPELRRMLAGWGSAEEEFAEEWRWVASQVELLTPFVNGEVDWGAAAVPDVMSEIPWAADTAVFQSSVLTFLSSPRARNFLVERALAEARLVTEARSLAELAALIQIRIEASLGTRVSR